MTLARRHSRSFQVVASAIHRLLGYVHASQNCIRRSSEPNESSALSHVLHNGSEWTKHVSVVNACTRFLRASLAINIDWIWYIWNGTSDRTHSPDTWSEERSRDVHPSTARSDGFSRVAIISCDTTPRCVCYSAFSSCSPPLLLPPPLPPPPPPLAQLPL